MPTAPAGSTRRTTTCSRPKRGWPASSPSPRATCPKRTGSTSAGRSRASAARRCCSRGARTLFEYLMPLLVMRTYPNTLLDESCRLGRPAPDGLRRGARRALGHLGVRLQPRRSARHLSVQGVRHPRARLEARPGRRGRRGAVRHRAGRRRSIRPPATANLRRLAAAGLEGEYGFFDAIDYTHRGAGRRWRPARRRRASSSRPTWPTTRA